MERWGIRMKPPALRLARAGMLVGLFCTAGAMVGCADRLAFATATTFGVSASQRADNTAELVLGYDRAEIVSIPAPHANSTKDGAGDLNLKDTYSVVGSFEAKYRGLLGSGSGLELRQIFATGFAARNAVANEHFMEVLGDRAGRAAAGKAARDVIEDSKRAERRQ